MSVFDFKKGLVKLGEGIWAYIQPDGSWGLSNAGLVVDQGKSLLVDTLYDVNLTNEMLAAMRTVAPEAETIDFLVNTHDNGDHWFGNEAARAGEIIATKACAEAMAGFTPETMAGLMKGASDLGDLGQFFLKCFGKYSYDNITAALPTRTFEGRLELEVGSRKVELIEVGPCHTTGDLIVYAPHAGTVFVADIMIVGGHQIMWAGPVANFIKTLDLILSLDPRYIVPGHGPVTDSQGALEIKKYWEYYTHEAKIRYDKGMESFDAAKDIPLGPYAGYHDSEKIVVNVNALYKEFSNDSDPIIPVEQFTFMSKW
ncbi:MAG: MBL fold metallo-hydrolase [Deltaproteobacteria bacterium]|nr:MAG: MBL fold metallo-hydrolase [Deltaproteobacteria bacterium]